jgi:SAM-dependent methyltransferase
MPPSEAVAAPGAEEKGRLWGARPGDWAATEEQQTPMYEAALARVGLRAGQRVLDVGCGTGVFLRLVADRGAHPCGLDAAAGLLELARSRVPEAGLCRGDLASLPYPRDRFDLVTGFTSFTFAEDIGAALGEAGRVARPGAAVFVQAWGAPDRCDLEAMKAIARRFRPAPPAAAPTLWAPGVLEELAARAGLTPEAAFDFRFAYEYADADALGRRLMAPGGLGEVVGPAREPAVRARIVAAMAPFRTADGGYRLENEFRCLVARAA